VTDDESSGVGVGGRAFEGYCWLLRLQTKAPIA